MRQGGKAEHREKGKGQRRRRQERKRKKARDREEVRGPILKQEEPKTRGRRSKKTGGKAKEKGSNMHNLPGN